MPVYLHLANLVFSKEAISTKYKGGKNQFRIDFQIGISKVNQEDDELFLIAKMNIDEFNFAELIEKGLSYDSVNNYSSDFVAITRYGGSIWSVDWLIENNTFAWHSQCADNQKEKAIEVGEKMTMDKIQELQEKGINVFETIKNIC